MEGNLMLPRRINGLKIENRNNSLACLQYCKLVEDGVSKDLQRTLCESLTRCTKILYGCVSAQIKKASANKKKETSKEDTQNYLIRRDL